jgi:bleomycin hydrolase
MKKSIVLTGLFTLGTLVGFTQQKKDKGVLQEKTPGYYQTDILKGIDDFKNADVKEEKSYQFKIDLTGKNLPTDPASYEQSWHNNPVSQGNTGTCWCFSTTSFYESEVKRISGKEVKLAEMYTVYWEYVERARYFVQNRGEMHFGEGSETNAVARMMAKHGTVPHGLYTGLKPGQKFHTHAQMFDELDAYLKSVKLLNAWNEEEVVATTKSILEHHMGPIPTKFKANNKDYTPQTYLAEELKLKMGEYVNFMSLMNKPYWEHSEYNVPDNWWHSDEYKNIPLKDYMAAIKGAIKDGYTISIGGDVSEAGFEKNQQVAMVPSFDIPSEYINEDARYFRFLNESTTDDHAMHMVGYKEVDGKTWFLIKDSGSGSRNCGEGCKAFGYYFFHEDYVKLKMMSITVHKDAVKTILKKMKAS